MTRGQHRALDELADDQVHAVGEATPNWPEIFGREAPMGVEIGFGMGQALLSWAAHQPDWNLLGIEVYQPGIGALLLGAQRDGLNNLQVLEGDAELAFEVNIDPDSLDEVRIFFPDPWPKKRHHKRRLVQPAFIKLLASRLKPGGRLLLATDWQAYAHWMLEVLSGEPLLENFSAEGFAQRAHERVITRFEARGTRLGHDVWDLAFHRR
jgi:tRNA (guanine-N7-)-methyltransferase